MRVSSMPPFAPIPPQVPPSVPTEPVRFLPFSAQAFDEARARHLPVFLIISTEPPTFSDVSLSMQIAERTLPVHLFSGVRTDVELLCQRAGALFSGEGALPLCALLLEDARPFLAAPLPPSGFPLDASRLYVWLSQADRRFSQNLPALTGQAAQVIRSFRTAPLRKPYSPHDAAHDLFRALESVQDSINGGFGAIKQPLVCALRFLQHESASGNRQAHTLLSRALDAMLASDLYDPLDGAFFRATLTEDWRIFIPEKPLGMNALLALTLLESGRRAEAVRALDFMLQSCTVSGGALTPMLTFSRESCSFTPEQVCAALGNEDGLRACRLLNLRRQHAPALPHLTPSRFSPVSDPPKEMPPLTPKLPASLTPDDAAFLRRVMPKLLHTRSARTLPQAAPYIVSEDCALAAAVFALCGRCLGEARYTQAAQRAVSYLISLSPAGNAVLPPSVSPAHALSSQATCGAAGALALALLTLGQEDSMSEYRDYGFRTLGAALHTFTTREGMPMYTPQDAAAFFPRLPAIYDSELPSPAALLLHALFLADMLRPQAGYLDAAHAIWEAAAPFAKEQPLACASLIDAANFTLSHYPHEKLKSF